MKLAIYFLGCCFLAWAVAIIVVVHMALSAVSDAKELLAKAPIILDHAEKVIGDAKDAAGKLGVEIAKARAAIPDVEKMKTVGTGVGAAGVNAVKTFALGIGHKDKDPGEEPADEVQAP